MGKKTQILLVVLLLTAGVRNASSILAFLQPFPATCLGGWKDAQFVRAEDYSSFWVWGGVKPQPALLQAESLYILQGQVSKRGCRTRLIAQGMDVARFGRGRVWLVYRAETLEWTPAIIQAMVARLRLWRLSGNPMVGLQVDFDAETKRLHDYASFLRHLRTLLPAECRLSITGLLDWSRIGGIDPLNRLRGTVDEMIFQTYQGRKTISNCAAYLQALDQLRLPFKIGIIQNGSRPPSKQLESSPWFRGYVVFLQNQR